MANFIVREERDSWLDSGPDGRKVRTERRRGARIATSAMLALVASVLVASGCAGKKRNFVSASETSEMAVEPGAVEQGRGVNGSSPTNAEGEVVPSLIPPENDDTTAAAPSASEDACGDACSGECEPGETQCTSPTERRECGIDALWSDPVACPSVCIDGACTGECSPASTECVTTTRFRECSELGVWSEVADCDFACVGEACGGACQPGQTRCASTTAVSICNDQGEFGATSACQNACAGNACTGECVPGATRCSSETQLQTCNEQGQFLAGTACPFACVNGACGGECSPGSRRCNPGTGVPQFCSSAGAWESQTPCQFVCTGSGTCGGECTPGSRRCSPVSGVPQLCSQVGSWQNQLSCPFVCSGGTCTGECSPGSPPRCDPATGRPQTCSQAGTLVTQEPCEVGSVCSGGACLCAAGRDECDNGCVDLDTDANNCAECGRSCFPDLGGTCGGGACTPTPIATGETLPGTVLLSDTHVYWITSTANLVRRVPRNGGAVETVFTGEAGLSAGTSNLLIENNQLYFASGTSTGGFAFRVMRSNLDGSNAVAFSQTYTGSPSIDSVVSTNGFIFHAVFNGTTTTNFVRQSSAGAQTDFGLISGRIRAMTAASGCIFYTTQAVPNQIIRKCAAGENVTHYNGTGVVVFQRIGSNDGANLFFTDNNGLSRIGLTAGSNVVRLTSVTPGAPVADPFDTTAVYYFTQTGSIGAPACTTAHTLFRAGKDIATAAPVVVAPPPHACPTGVAVAADALYWSNREGGTVMKLGK